MVERVAKMPRDYKFSVGDKFIEACLSVTTHLVDAMAAIAILIRRRLRRRVAGSGP